MLSFRPKFLVLLPVPLAVTVATAQDNLAGAAQIRLALARLNVVGSVLMIAAHPDDEQAATLAWLARGRAIRAAYLSVTRGEGGQNLIGPEQGDLLGIIRTEEMLAARRVDGAEQFFTRAVDFGYTKTADETFSKWGHERILSDIVWVIRRFRPDVVILCFSGTARDGHGQHQASSILGKEAFSAAADNTRFPDQLAWVQPWQAKRLVWNVWGPSDAPGQIHIDTGEFNPALGYSYLEIAVLSRNMHRSQATGAIRRRGTSPSSFVPVLGEPATNDLFDGIDTTWGRIPGGTEAGRLLAEAARTFDDEHPGRVVPLLLQARAQIRELKDPLAAAKLAELDESIALVCGLWLDASADRWAVTPGSKLGIRITALNRSQVPITLASVSAGGAALSAPKPLPFNRPEVQDLSVTIQPDRAYSQPYWLARPHGEDYYDTPGHAEDPENAPFESAAFVLQIGNEKLTLLRPVHYRYADGSLGEVVRPVTAVPPVALEFAQPVVVFPDRQPKKIEVLAKSNAAGVAGNVRLEVPAGWRAEPEERAFSLASPGDERTLAFNLTPTNGPGRGQIRAVTSIGGRDVAVGTRVISYPHFPPQVVFPPSVATLVRADVRILAKRIGYVMGAGDEVPEALRQLGCQVTLLSQEDLATGDLAGFDAILTGVRAYNLRPDLAANQGRLMDYVSNGGTLVVQYNVLERNAPLDALARIGPYPIHIGRDRVSVEEAPVVFSPDAPLLAAPNRIAAADFDGWVQERGLYFASDWDPRYKTLFESHDPGDGPLPGGTLYTRFGKGAYVFTAYSWFRQLPAGVPGAYRIFANLLSAGKTLE